MDNSVLSHCHRAFGVGNNRKQQMFCHPFHYTAEAPSWVEGDKMEAHFSNFKELMENGRIIWGVLIQANVLLFSEGDDDCPGELLYCTDPNFSDLGALMKIRDQIGSLKGTKPEDPELGEIAHYLTDEMIRVFGLDVPKVVSGNLNCKISTTFFMRKHFPDRMLSQGIMPILTYQKNGETFATPVPSDFWPEDFKEWWIHGMPLELTMEEEGRYKEEDDEDDLSPIQIRLAGLGITIVGLIILGIFAGYPLYKAHNGADAIDISRKLIFLGIFAVEAGVFTVILGRNILTLVKAVMPQDGYQTKLSDLPMLFWVIAISSLVLIIYAYSWFEGELEKLGFKTY